MSIKPHQRLLLLWGSLLMATFSTVGLLKNILPIPEVVALIICAIHTCWIALLLNRRGYSETARTLLLVVISMSAGLLGNWFAGRL